MISVDIRQSACNGKRHYIIAFELWKLITVAVQMCQTEKERNSDKRVIYLSFCTDSFCAYILMLFNLASSSLVIIFFFHVSIIFSLEIIFTIIVVFTTYKYVFVLFPPQYVVNMPQWYNLTLPNACKIKYL